MRLPATSRQWGVGAVLVISLLVVPWLLPQYAMFILTTWLIIAIFGMSLDILIGYLGYVSFGHAAFYGLGAYGVMLAALNLGQSMVLNVLVALLVVIAVAAIFGAIVLRVARMQFIMITLALAQALWGLVFRWSSVTGGDSGLVGLARPTLPLFGDLQDPYYFYYFVVTVFAASTVLLIMLVRSPLGLTWKGIKDNEPRMRALGYNVWLHKYIAYMVAALFGGVAGILNSYLTGFVSPEAVSLTTSATVILVVILGGVGTIVGAFIGAGIVVLVRHVASSYTDRWSLLLGLIYMVCVLILPYGIAGVPRRLRQRWSGNATRTPTRTPIGGDLEVTDDVQRT